MPRSIVIHGHYYQPPREDPWLDEIERQPSAAPFHDWNQRIERECYRAVVSARVLDDEGRIARIINALAWTSFDMGPTLLAWLEREAPTTYASVLEADRESAVRLGGHGNAMAQAYHHTILPLASRRDKTTEVRWGVADFRRRFGRQPEGLWLPETAVDDETLDVLAAEGIRFTVLAPHQVVGAPAHGLPGMYKTSNGREIALFVYDGPMSHGIAFGGLLADAKGWAARLTAGLADNAPPDLVAAATDGETFGHHHRFGEMALAAVIDTFERDKRVRLDNFASVLASVPSLPPVTLAEPTSWSCEHGVERWRSDCGCGSTTTSPSQAWRVPLRTAVTALADGLHDVFAREAPQFFPDPWAARDTYAAENFAGRTTELPVRARELLELERNALRLFTSCAWFFDDIDRLEPLQIMRYAARGIELAGEDGRILESRFLSTLQTAVGNDEGSGTGRDIYLRKAKPRHSRFAALAAVRSLAHDAGVTPPVPPCCKVEQSGSRVMVCERQTGREHHFVVTRIDAPVESDGAWRRLRHATLDVREVDHAPNDGHGSSTNGTSPAETRAGARLTLDDIPGTEREALLAAARSDIVARSLDANERARLAAGDLPADVLPNALLRAVNALSADRGAAAVARVLDLADMAEELGTGIPYDVQTAFARVRGELAGAPMLLAPVAQRLGFAPRDRPAERALSPT